MIRKKDEESKNKVVGFLCILTQGQVSDLTTERNLIGTSVQY